MEHAHSVVLAFPVVELHNDLIVFTIIIRYYHKYPSNTIV